MATRRRDLVAKNAASARTERPWSAAGEILAARNAESAKKEEMDLSLFLGVLGG
jgi:hypothetical protein